MCFISIMYCYFLQAQKHLIAWVLKGSVPSVLTQALISNPSNFLPRGLLSCVARLDSCDFCDDLLGASISMLSLYWSVCLVAHHLKTGGRQSNQPPVTTSPSPWWQSGMMREGEQMVAVWDMAHKPLDHASGPSGSMTLDIQHITRGRRGRGLTTTLQLLTSTGNIESACWAF